MDELLEELNNRLKEMNNNLNCDYNILIDILKHNMQELFMAFARSQQYAVDKHETLKSNKAKQVLEHYLNELYMQMLDVEHMIDDLEKEG